MNNHRTHIVPIIGRAALGAILAAGAIGVPLGGAAFAASPASMPTQVGCLPILCSPDGRGVDIDLDVDLGILTGGPSAPAPAPTPTPTPAPAPLPGPGNIVDLGIDLGVGVDLGDVAVVDATVPVDVVIGSDRNRPISVGAATSPVVDATLLPGSGVPLADLDVSGVDVAVGAIVPGGDHTDAGLLGVGALADVTCLAGLGVIGPSELVCSGNAGAGVASGLADLGVRADICNISVAVLRPADRASCASGSEDPAGDAPAGTTTADPTDGTGGMPGTVDRSTRTPAADGSGSATDRPSAIRRSQADEGANGPGLPVTGASVFATLALAAAATAAGAGSLAVKRRRSTT